MERKFESELGRDISSGRNSKPSPRLGVVGATVASCALLLSIAGMSLAMGGLDTPGGPPFMVDEVVFNQEVDEIAAGDLGDAAVKRVMSLKYKTVTPQGDVDVPFTKFSYVMNFAFNESVNIKGSEVGKLALTFTADDLLLDPLLFNLAGATALVTTSITGVDLVGADALPISGGSSTVVYLDNNAIEVSIVVPVDLVWDVSIGDSLSISVTIEIEEHVLHGSVVETPWAGLYEDYIGDF
jgi:hypothetical protein